jgi:leader peptidase (prepilin peptidase)/N-methyltransferase
MHSAGFLFFIFGAIFGSFLNVVALRYDPEKPLFGGQLSGRSHCSHCGKTLRFFELVPILSFVLLRGRCARCKAPLSLVYPAGELVTALSFAAIPGIVMRVFPGSLLNWTSWGIAGVLAAAFATLIVAALIDLRTYIIPDEIHIILALLAVASGFLMAPHFGPARGAYTGGYSLIFGFHDGILFNRILGAVVGGLFFLVLYYITLRRGMGLGDVKLAASIGLFMGWPDGLLACMLAFCLGAVASLPLLLLKKTRLKAFVPFGPFLSLGAIVVMVWGDSILRWYFHLFRG